MYWHFSLNKTVQHIIDNHVGIINSITYKPGLIHARIITTAGPAPGILSLRGLLFYTFVHARRKIKSGSHRYISASLELSEA